MRADEYVLSSEDEKDCEGFTSLFSNNDTSNQSGNSGQSSVLKTGRIIKIQDDIVMVDIGEKSEKRMNIAEIQDEDGKLIFNEGSEIALLVSGRNISYKQGLKKQRQDHVISRISNEDYMNRVIDVEVVFKNKAGYIVRWIDEDIECFLPNKEAVFKQNVNYTKKLFKVSITRVDSNGIRVSRKKFFDISNKNKEESIKNILSIQGAIKGKVTNVTSFGVFVDINGVEGLVHLTELSYKSYVNPASLYKIGDVVEVKVLKYNEEKSKLSLSIKALQENPWENIENELKVGYTIKVVVSSIQNYGVFVDAGNDIEGFLHITELSWDKSLKNPKSILKLGQELDVEIVELDSSKKRLRVSLKKTMDKPFIKFARDYKEGDIVSGSIATITDFGAFVSLGGIDGLLHNEDLSWDKHKKCKDELKVGDKIEVKILRIDKENEKISLSRRALLESPVASFAKNYNIGDIVNGKVVEIKDFGVFIALSDDIDALIKNEDLYPMKKDEISIGDNIEASILSIDSANNKIRVSVKKLAKKKEYDEIKNYSSDEKMTLGDVLKDKIK